MAIRPVLDFSKLFKIGKERFSKPESSQVGGGTTDMMKTVSSPKAAVGVKVVKQFHVLKKKCRLVYDIEVDFDVIYEIIVPEGDNKCQIFRSTGVAVLRRVEFFHWWTYLSSLGRVVTMFPVRKSFETECDTLKYYIDHVVLEDIVLSFFRKLESSFSEHHFHSPTRVVSLADILEKILTPDTSNVTQSSLSC